MEDSTTLECIRTVAATYVYKIYNRTNTKRMNTDTKGSANDTTKILVHAAQKTKDYRLEVFVHVPKLD